MSFNALRELLFLLPTETSHHLSMQSIAWLQQMNLTPLIAKPRVEDPVEVMGIRFPNRVGLAAGLDKDAACVDGLAALGFGFVEVGTVTPVSQPGNVKPRLFRLREKQAIINRMGFNNLGVDALVRRVKQCHFDGVLGINIGKNKLTPLEQTLDDYVTCLRKVYRHSSYVTINISSPNTKDLRALQHGDELAMLLEGIKLAQRELEEQYERYVPLVVKIAPDLDDDELRIVCQQLMAFEIDGVIVSNTTISRSEVKGAKHAGEAGGLSGAPLFKKSNHVLEAVVAEVQGKIAVIGVGGIMTGDDAAEKIRLGADLVQIYTGFIFEGPALVESSARAIAAVS
ncbi:MAG: dihydroorotate dehydrogenase [Candidatus Azotimanducaceae bacterium]|jgi:dihydroorotate dehydrogenase